MVKFSLSPQLITTLNKRLGGLSQRCDQIQSQPSFSDAQFNSLRKDTTRLQEHLAMISDAASEQDALWVDEFKPFTERATALEHQIWTGTRHPPGRMPDKDDVLHAVDRYLSVPTADGAARPWALVMPQVEQALEHVPGMEAHFTRFPERIALLSMVIAVGGLVSNPLQEDKYAPFYLFLLNGMLNGSIAADQLIREKGPRAPFEKLNAAFRHYSELSTFLGDEADRYIAVAPKRGDDHSLSESRFTVFQEDTAITRNILTQAMVYHIAVRENLQRHMPFDSQQIALEEGGMHLLIPKSILWAAHEGIYGPITHAAQATERAREPIRLYYSLYPNSSAN